MTEKIILITGATAGIGKTTALALAKQGYYVIVHGRSEDKARTVVQEIKAQSGNDRISYLVADLCSMNAIKQMTEQFKERFDHLDVLINNAGAVFDTERTVSADGIEKTMALNVIAPFLLNQLLLNRLEKSTDGRMINMSSASHRASGRPNLDDLNLEKHYSAQRRYSLSKLYVIWNTQHQARELQNSGITNVTVNVSHPGAVATNFGQDSDKGFWTNLIYKVALRFMASPEQGATTNSYLATSPEVKGVSGKFFGNSKEQKPSTRYYSLANEQKLWDYCMKVVSPFL